MNSTENNCIAVIWQRFGAYHVARLCGANHVLEPHGWKAVGVEVSNSDHYEWDSIAGEYSTALPGQAYEGLSRRQIAIAITRELDRLQPQAVAVNGWSVAEAIAATNWCSRHKRPAILMSETHESSRSWWKELVKRWRVRSCDAAVVGGKWHRDYLVGLGFPKERIFIGYDAVDNDHFVELRTDKTTENRQLPERFFYANTRFLPRKNIDGLLRAFAIYREKTPSDSWKLVITGSGEMEQAWKALASELQIADHVHWPGFIQYDELPRYYQAAQAFVHPAHREAWGLVLNEAAATGLPILAGNQVGAACELIAEGKNGYSFASDSVEQLADCLLKIHLLKPSERREMGEYSRRLVDDLSARRYGEAIWSAIQVASHS